MTEKNTLLAKTEVLTNSAEFGIINQREFFDHDIVNENNIGGYYIVRERDFVYNPRISVSAPVGPINCNKLGKSGVMSPLYTVFRVHDIDSVYLEYFFKTSRWHSFMRFNGDSGVRSDRFSIKTELFYKMPIPITKYCEQVKIGKYFSQLDHLISLHQRKLEMLKKVKKSMLEKMFPKNDAKVPELRFSDFTDAWEQRRLGEIVERVTRKNENLESTLPLTISAQYGLIDQNEFFDKRIASKDVSGYFLIRRGEFAYNKSTSTDAPWGAIKCLERYENGVLSTLYIVFRIIDEKKLNSNYLAFYYDTDLWHRGVQAIAAEGARNHGLLNIAPVDFFETTLAIPQDIFEQQKIGLFFKQLDHLISLHQRKLEKLKNIKKSMLEKMFII